MQQMAIQNQLQKKNRPFLKLQKQAKSVTFFNPFFYVSKSNTVHVFTETELNQMIDIEFHPL